MCCKVHRGRRGRMQRRDVLKAGVAGLAPTALGTAGSSLALGACTPRRPTLRVALIEWIGYAFLYLAKEKLAARQRELRLVEFPSNTAAMTALFNGDVGIAALTLDEVLRAREGGLDAQVILVIDQSHGADVIMARPDVGGLAQLKGLRVAVEASAGGALMLSKLLSAAGLSASDVVKVDATADRHVDAYRRGEVDVVVTFEPIASALRREGALTWMDSRQFPELIVDVLAVRRDRLQEDPEGHRMLLQGYFEATSDWRRAPAQAEMAIAKHMQMAVEDVSGALSGLLVPDLTANRAWLSGQEPRLMRSARELGALMAAQGLLRRAPQLEGLCDPAYLPEARA